MIFISALISLCLASVLILYYTIRMTSFLKLSTCCQSHCNDILTFLIRDWFKYEEVFGQLLLIFVFEPKEWLLGQFILIFGSLFIKDKLVVSRHIEDTIGQLYLVCIHCSIINFKGQISRMSYKKDLDELVDNIALEIAKLFIFFGMDLLAL